MLTPKLRLDDMSVVNGIAIKTAVAASTSVMMELDSYASVFSSRSSYVEKKTCETAAQPARIAGIP